MARQVLLCLVVLELHVWYIVRVHRKPKKINVSFVSGRKRNRAEKECSNWLVRQVGKAKAKEIKAIKTGVLNKGKGYETDHTAVSWSLSACIRLLKRENKKILSLGKNHIYPHSRLS